MYIITVTFHHEKWRNKQELAQPFRRLCSFFTRSSQNTVGQDQTGKILQSDLLESYQDKRPSNFLTFYVLGAEKVFINSLPNVKIYTCQNWKLLRPTN